MHVVHVFFNSRFNMFPIGYNKVVEIFRYNFHHYFLQNFFYDKNTHMSIQRKTHSQMLSSFASLYNQDYNLNYCN